MNTQTPDVSIIMACRNEAGGIVACLDSILGQSRNGFCFEVIVADGRSVDGTRQILEEYGARHPGVVMLDNPGRIASTGLNLALGVARGKFILRMDAHSEYQADYVEKCLEALSQGMAENVGGAARTRSDGYLQQAIASAFHSSFACGGARFHDDRFEGYVDTVPYGCWSRETLQRLGGFDESLVRNQDDELNLRLIRSGGRVWQSAWIVSWYHPRNTLRKLFRQYFQYGFWKVAVIRKHGSPASWRHLAPAAFVGTEMILLVLSVAGFLPELRVIAWPAASAAAVAMTCYLAANLGASVLTARRFGFRFLPVLPAVFATYHVSYGVGFLLGLFRFRSGSARAPRMASELSR